MKKFFGIALIAVLGLFLVACNDVTTKAPTTDGTTDTQQSTETTVSTDTTETTETTVAVDLTALVTALKAEYAATLENETFLAIEDLSLLESISGFAITWTSTNTDYLANDGTVTRPAFTVGDQTVGLSASVTDGTVEESYTFWITVKALDKSDQERADEVFLLVTAFPSKDFWTAADEETLEFVTTGDDADGTTYTVTWTSSNPASLTVDGEITQSIDSSVAVTMTASITINDVEYTYAVEFTIAQIEAATDVATIAEALALEEGAYVNIQGVTVYAIDQTGDVFITDGTDVLYIYLTPFTAEVGDVLDVSGEVAYHFFTPQLISTDLHPVVVAESDAAVSVTPVVQIASVSALVDLLDVPAANAPFSNKAYQLTTKIYYNEDWGNYSVFLVNTDYDFSAALPDGAKQPNGDKIMIYYKGDIDVLKALHGKEVTLDVLTLGWRSDKLVFYVDFFGTPEDLDVVFANDTEAVAAALSTVSFPGEVTESTTLSLPASYYGVALSYASDDEVLIDPTTGVVDLTTLTSLDNVKITVTATKGDVTDTKEFDIQVGELPISTVGEVVATENGVMMQVQGVVYAIIKNGFFIEDETGKLFIFTDKDSFDYNLGDEVLLIGTVADYHAGKQLKSIAAYNDALATGEEYEQTPIEYVDGTTTMMPGYVYTITGRVAIETSGEYTNTYIYFNDTDKTVIYYNSPDDSVAALETFDGKLVTADYIYYNDKPYLVFVGTADDITEVVTTDAEKVAADVAAIEFGGNIFAATTINLPATGTNGSAITWAETTDVDEYAAIADGVLTIAEPTGEATVVITGTFVLNDVTVTSEITFTLLNVTAVDLGDFENQTKGNTVAISGVVYAVAQNGFFVEDATGQLFVFSYGATYKIGDEVELIGTVAEYNGSYQLADVIELTDALSTGNEVDMEAVMYVPGTTTVVPGQLYTVIGTVAIEGEHNNVFIYYSETEAFGIYYKSPEASIDVLEALVGEMVAVQIVYYNDGTSFVYCGGTEGVQIYAEVTDFSEFFTMTDGTNYDLANGTLIKLTGVVTGNSYDGLFVEDANGAGFFMFRPDETNINIGDKVVYLGELTTYNGARQLAYGAELLEVLSSDNALQVNITTADAIDAFTIADAGTLFTFAGFTYEGLDGSHMILGYTLADGTTEGTVMVRYYSNWDGLSLVAEMYAVGDALPEIEFILYNFRDGETQIDVVAVPVLEAAAAAFETTLTNALAYEYGDYTFNVNTQTVSGLVVNNVYLESELLAYYADDMNVGVMHDLARFLGALYRATDSSVAVIVYDDVDYTWNAEGTLAGSNWEDASGVTLVSVITAHFVDGTLTNSVMVTLEDAAGIAQDLTLNLTITLDVSEGPVVPELFISEYVEGGGFNKVIEIYNPTGSIADLTGYVLRYYSNGGENFTELDLSTYVSIAIGDVLVLTNNNAAVDAAILAESDAELAFITHNGDDCYELVKDGVVIDSLGVWGDTDWGKDVTLVRLPNLVKGNGTYTTSEWDSHAKDTLSFVGDHTVTE